MLVLAAKVFEEMKAFLLVVEEQQILTVIPKWRFGSQQWVEENL